MLDGYLQKFLELIGARSENQAPAVQQAAETSPRPVAQKPAQVKDSRPAPQKAAPPQGEVARGASPRPATQPPKAAPVAAAAPTSLPASAPSASGRPTMASDETVAKILKGVWNVITATGQVGELSKTQKKYVVLIANPESHATTLLVAQDSHLHPDVSAARQHLRRRGQVWSREVTVDYSVIRQVYDKVEDANEDSRGSGDIAQRGKDFMQLVKMAADEGSSDLHLTVRAHQAIVELREEGELTPKSTILAPVAAEICAAAFAMADNSDPTYKALEGQSAQITEATAMGAGLKLPAGVQSLRLQFSFLPPAGRYLVARLLYEQKAAIDADIDTLGYGKNHIRDINMMREATAGVNIVSGPTGSGKSTTLQVVLTNLKQRYPGKNIISIEDPPEYNMPGVKQLAVTNARTDRERTEAMNRLMSEVLREDPDIVMVGEIRDAPGASLMFKAAMSGHGVYTTLHTNDAASILDRLRDMGVEPYKLGDASLVTGLIGQRLVKKLNQTYAIGFDEARKDSRLPEEDFEYLREITGGNVDKIRFYGGYKLEDPKLARGGRRIVGEAINPDQQFLDLYFDKNKAAATRYWLDELGGITMFEHAMTLVLTGQLCPVEFKRVLGRLQKVKSERLPMAFAAAGL
jgi:type II secretory ATPase GspE/PulE/Tfp pilus assembly ATPase PilB-like protein